jgi:site-specific recombinase XerD
MGRKLPKLLRDSDQQALFHQARRQRDRLILMILRYTGLRNAELRHLRIDDLDLTRRTLFVDQGKGSKDRVLPLPTRLVGPLRDWIGDRNTGLVFPSPRGGGPLSARCLQMLIKRLAVKAGLPGAMEARRFKPHALRHAFASSLLDNGASIREVQELLGHSRLETTALYTHVRPERLAAVVDRLDLFDGSMAAEVK